MDKNNASRRINPRVIIIVVLALIILAECAFLLLHRSGDAGAAAADAAAPKTSDAAAQDNAGSTEQNGSDPQVSDAPDASPEVSGAPEASAAPEGGGASGSADAPAPTPAVVIPPENKGKSYAGAIGAMANYAKSPSASTLAYLLGGELTGDQMQRFLPALLTMSGSSLDLLVSETNADLDLPQGTTSLIITDERALSQDQIESARAKLRDMKVSFDSMGALANEVRSYTDSEWAELGSSLDMSGPDAKRMFTDLTSASNAIAALLNGAAISEAYQVTLKTNTGETMVTDVYCINGKWVTSAFFHMQFS